ncbi:MAG: DUF4363 family protein [Oscillospiraceae bacterium]|nr:DUF4363 family protein [Oscillospiraceae bacterium]
MKRLWYALVLVVIALGISFTEIIAVRNSYNTFIKTIDDARTAVENKDYKRAKSLGKDLENKWIEKEKKLNYLLEHSVLDELSMNIAELSDLSSEDSKNDFLSDIDKIKRQFIVLYTNELPYGDNIF